MTSTPADLTIPEALAALRRGELTPLELTDACLRRIEETDGAIRAWNLVDAEGARAQARRVEGPLAGIPLGIKDIFDVQGLPTTASSKVLQGNIAGEDAPVVARLRKAGAVILGKTNTHEFAYGFVSAPTCNPWDPKRIPGGSSGGSAAAVATSQCLGAVGSDTGGSVRVPPALCGVYGLKPRWGIVPVEGVIPLAPTLDVVGPIERTAEGLTLLWDIIAGTSTELSLGEYRVGIPQTQSLGDIDSDVERVFNDAVEVLGSFAKIAHDIPHPAFESFDVPRAAILMPQALEVHHNRGWWPDRRDLYSEELQTYLTFTEGYFTPEVIGFGKEESEHLVAQMLEALQDVDVLATPTTPVTAPTHEQAALVEEGGLRREVALILGRYTGPANMAGLAAISIPCGFSSDGLPVGLQLIGRDEQTLLRIARAFEKETSWTERRPALLG